MPPHPPPPSATTHLTKPTKPYFFYGHRKPTQHRPTVQGGLFTNRQTINPTTTTNNRRTQPSNFDLRRWDPDSISQPMNDPSEQFFNIAKTLSPIARYIVDSFRKHKQWGPPLVSDLNRLRRVTPKLVSEVLKVPHLNPRISTKFFHWAGKQKGYKHDFACYNAYSYFLNRTNQFRSADQVPEMMDTQGKPPSEKQFEILIRMHADANRGLRVYYIYEKMKKFGIKPRVFLYNRIMDSLVKTNHLDLALSVYHDFKEEKLVEESVTFMILIKGLCKNGRINESFDLLNKMRNNLCKPDVFAYTSIIKLLISEKNLDDCLKVWEEMKRDKIEPDSMAYATLITGLCEEKRVEKAYELFQEMKVKKCIIDRSVYGTLIEAFVIDRKVGSACKLLQDMLNSGYRGDLVIYNSLIRGLCNENRVNGAYKLFQVIVSEDLQPDFITVLPLLVSYAKSNQMDAFFKLLKEMTNLGFRVLDDLSKFFTYMVKFDNRDRVSIELTLKVFEDLKVRNFTSVSIYNILIEALFKIGEVNKAILLFNEVDEPDFLTYSYAIQCFVEVNNVEEACLCYNKIKEKKWVPSIEAYRALVKGLCKICEIDNAEIMIRDCLANVINGPIEFKYFLMIVHVCKVNDSKKVIEVIDEMIEQGYGIDNVVYSGVILGMCKNGSIEEARKVFLDMKKREFLSEAEVIMYDEILVEYMKKKTGDLVVLGLKFFGLESKLKSKGCNLLP